LRKAPLAQLLVYLERQAWTGSLWLYDDHSDSTVLFVDGAPAKVRTTLPVPPLGELLMELGFIDRVAYDQTIHFALRGGGLHGAMLMACGKLDQETLEAGLREQTALRLIELFRQAQPASRFAFYRDVDLLASWGGVELTPVDPWWVLWWGSRHGVADESVRSALALLGHDPIVLQRDTEWERFGFDDEERAFLKWWGGHEVTVPDLLTYPGLPSDRVELLLYVLFLTGRFAFAEVPAPVPSKVRQPAKPAPEREQDQHELAPQPRAEMDSVTEVFFRPEVDEPATKRMPSVPDTTVPTGPPSFVRQVEASYQSLDIPVHMEEADEVAEPIAQITENSLRMEQAFQTLLDPFETGEEEPPAPRGPTNSELDLARNLEAMRWSSQALTAMRRGDFDEAEQYAAAALKLSPGNALLKTEYAWAAFHQPARRKIGDVGDLLDMLREATDADPALDRPYYVRGEIFAYLGMHAKAYAEYRAAFARNAHNAEAAAKIGTYVRNLNRYGTLDPDGTQPSPPKTSPMSIPNRAGAIFSRLWKRD
jgi:tetratricopeptide (TPR) repeat protein